MSVRVLLLGFLMALSAFVGAFSTGTGTSSLPITGVGFLPKFLFFFATGRAESTTGQGRAQHDTVFGFACSTSNRLAWGSNSVDAAAAGDAALIYRTDSVIVSVDTAGVIDGRMDLASFDADGFTLSIADGFPEDRRISFLALGGDDLTNAQCGVFASRIDIGTDSVTGIAFPPNCVMLGSVFETGAPPVASATRNSVALGFGTGAADQVAWAYAADEASVTSDAASIGRSGEIINVFTSNVGTNYVTERASLQSLNADGFTIDWTEKGGGSQQVFWVALRGGHYKVSEILTSVTPAAQVPVTGFGFTPKAALFLSQGRAESGADTHALTGQLSIGAATSPTNRAAHGMIDLEGLADTVVATAIRNDAIYVSQTVATPPVVEGLADLQSFDADGLTIVMDDGDGVAAWIGILAIGDAASGSAAITGTAAGVINETDIIAGGRTIILTLTGDTFVASGGTFDAERQAIIDGLDSAQSETTGWNAEVRDKLVVTDVVRDSDTQVTITLTAQSAYNITAPESITVTIPASALVGGVPTPGSPPITVYDIDGMLVSGGPPANSMRPPPHIRGA